MDYQISCAGDIQNMMNIYMIRIKPTKNVFITKLGKAVKTSKDKHKTTVVDSLLSSKII